MPIFPLLHACAALCTRSCIACAANCQKRCIGTKNALLSLPVGLRRYRRLPSRTTWPAIMTVPSPHTMRYVERTLVTAQRHFLKALKFLHSIAGPTPRCKRSFVVPSHRGASSARVQALAVAPDDSFSQRLLQMALADALAAGQLTAAGTADALGCAGGELDTAGAVRTSASTPGYASDDAELAEVSDLATNLLRQAGLQHVAVPASGTTVPKPPGVVAGVGHGAPGAHGTHRNLHGAPPRSSVHPATLVKVAAGAVRTGMAATGTAMLDLGVSVAVSPISIDDTVGGHRGGAMVDTTLDSKRPETPHFVQDLRYDDGALPAAAAVDGGDEDGTDDAMEVEFDE